SRRQPRPRRVPGRVRFEPDGGVLRPVRHHLSFPEQPEAERRSVWSYDALTSDSREDTMRDAVIVDAVRTPVGRRNGSYKDVHPVDLSAHVLNALVERTGIDPAVVDDVVWGTVGQVGEQALNVGRNAVLGAGWPESVPGTTVDRQCGSSQQAVHFAAAGVLSGQYDVAVAGGVEAMTRVPMGSSIGANVGFPFGPKMLARYEGQQINQGLGAEMI